MGKLGLLHISDFHISDFNLDNGEIIRSRFSNEVTYKKKFIEKIKDLKKEFGIEDLKVVITGDLANSGEKDEYSEILILLNEFCNEIRIKANDIFIVPGNHDINWLDLKHHYNRVSDKKLNPNEYHKEKFKQFIDFLSNFYECKKHDFELNSGIFKTYSIPDKKILILGLNSSYRESYLPKDHVGYVMIEGLDEKITELEKQYPNWHKIAIMHHNPISLANKGQSIENWNDVGYFLRDCSTVLYGHRHKDESIAITTKDTWYYVGAGSLGKIIPEWQNSFNLLVEDVYDQNNIEFSTHLYCYIKPNDIWQEIDDAENNKKIILSINKGFSQDTVPQNNSVQDEVNPISHSETLPASDKFDFGNLGQNVNKTAHDLVKIIRDNQYFKSGHFHWGELMRTHNWIDTNSLLSNNEYLQICQIALINMIQNRNIGSDLVIGIGMEGNILGAFVAAILGCAFSYFPNINRNSHSKFERQLPDNLGKKITIITDVVFEAESVKKILEYKKAKFEKVEEINLVALFYTGAAGYDKKVFQTIDKRINFHCVCDLIKVSKCRVPDYTCCSIYKNKLDTVNEFYS